MPLLLLNTAEPGMAAPVCIYNLYLYFALVGGVTTRAIHMSYAHELCTRAMHTCWASIHRATD